MPIDKFDLGTFHIAMHWGIGPGEKVAQLSKAPDINFEAKL